MLLAVAGLDDKAIQERTRKLADGRLVAASRRPSGRRSPSPARCRRSRGRSTDEDVERLSAHFGPERALDVIWWACRCHYMTRVADAFQLPLERENVFAP